MLRKLIKIDKEKCNGWGVPAQTLATKVLLISLTERQN